mmetsp:Transcript_1545/g.2128  ORF Transcript_1545/g.2128 Transcript_1545/m.2128 type:complete len:200 (+) Transcript_1545:326-925(+)|eukprot:CAMPEP_0185573048 /NCGR_PEP_ID=MMETSP0434-20130131/4865_1 /TAXON_ID=626734 ORGANISM="Favella taraikaensis, Strain Fe Narragansett Bay" /NCGR_SAMPLE_ID=MMETSP0434 /ASSEMBLY_ACC=CAM_ASM_000379 /LENGTH=199 /DNA_ID=CAMNT_0028189155 /DNA_START=288 /DNA_END=887 /DNA_ORIENTATION=+
MREITAQDTQDKSLVGINAQLRVRYERDVRFHGVIVCYDVTNAESFTESVRLYKTLMTRTDDSAKVSPYAKLPVAFCGTKLDLTSFLESNGTGVAKAVEVAELRPWLKKTHKRAENACFECSSFQNIGVSILVEWMTRSALRIYHEIEATKPYFVPRFTSGNQAPAFKGNMKVLLARAGHIDIDDEDEDVQAAAQKWRN